MEKVKLSPKRFRVLLTVEHPAVQKALACAGGLAAGFLLSGARIVGVWIPISASLVAALGSTLPAAAAWVGAALGCFLLWGSDAMLLNVSAGILILAAAWGLQETPISCRRGFCPVLAAIAAALVGILFLCSDGFSGKTVVAFLLRLLLLPAGTLAAQKVLQRQRGVPLCAALFALISGSGGILLPAGIPVGAVFAAGAVFALPEGGAAPIMAALGGLALDWCDPGHGSAVTVLTAAALAASLPYGKRRHRYIAFCLAAGLTVILSAGENIPLFAATVLGGGLALLLPPIPEDKSVVPLRDTAKQRLHIAAAAMEEVYKELDDTPTADRSEEISDLYDAVTAQVCMRCARFQLCWRQNGEETCGTLQAAATVFLKRGTALPQDFPAAFADTCRHFDDFLAALDEQLDHLAAMEQKSRYRRELKTVLGSHYRVMADYLRLSVLPPRELGQPHYTPDVACRRLAKNGSICGDRSACFRQAEHYYFLLCDGMGTGEAASAESKRVISLLSRLLQAGMEPEGALEILGGLCILREDGGAATVDLVSLNLTDGSGTLFKWGSAPSYLKCEDQIIKLGTASLPPGMGVGGTQQAEQIRLSLGKGEVLILTSDGIGGEGTEQFLQQAVCVEPRELAAGIVAGGSDWAEDDRTAAVLCLRPLAS